MAKRSSKLGNSVLDLDIDDSKFHSKLSGAYKAAQAFTADAGTNLTKAGKAMTSTGDAMTRNITVPILAAGGATTKLALDFDTTMNQIVGLAKVPRDQIQGVRDDILKMAGEIGRSPQELAEAFYFVASAGFDANTAMQVLEISAKAAASGMGQTQDVAKVLGGVLNAYGHENISAARAGDILTAAIQDGAAEASGFAGAIGQVVPTAASLGVSFDQVTAAMAAMTDVGVDVDTAATNLNQIFTSLLKPTKEAEDALNGVGLSAAGLRQELKEKGLLATLRTVHDAFEGNSAAIAAVFGNIRALRGVDALLQLDQKQLTDIFKDTAGAVGTLGQAYSDTEGSQRDIDRDMADLQATAIEIGEDVLPTVVEVLHDLAGGAKEFGKWWRGLDEPTRKMVVQMAAFLAIAGPMLSIVGRITTGVGGLTKGLGWFIKNEGKLASALGTTRLGLLGIAGVIIGGGLLVGQQFSDSIDKMVITTLEKLGAQSGKTAKEVDEDVAKIADGLGVTVPEAAKTLANAIVSNGGDYDAAVDLMLSKTRLAAMGIVSSWGQASGAVGDNISAFDRGAATMNDTVAGFSDGVTKTTAATTGAVEQMTDEQEQAAAEAHQVVVDEVKALFADLTSILTNREQFDKEWQAFLDELEDPWPDKSRRLAIETKLASKSIQEGLNSKDSQIRTDTLTRVNNLIAQYELLAPGALEAGKLVNPALGKGINSNVEKAYQLAKDIAKKAGLSLEDPDVWKEAGLSNMYDFIKGVEAQKEAARLKAIQVAKDAARAMAERDDFHRSGFTAGGGFNEGVEDQEPGARTAGGKLNKGAKDGASGSLYMPGYNVGQSWIDGLIAALRANRFTIATEAGRATSGLRGKSPPKEGPLHEIDKWGFNVGSAWTGGFMDALASLDIAGPMGHLSANLAGLRAPSLGALGPMASGLGNAVATPSSMPTSITNQWILNVEGKPKVVGSREDVIDAWQQLGGFGSV